MYISNQALKKNEIKAIMIETEGVSWESENKQLGSSQQGGDPMECH